jgi:hypothetical protein
VFKQIDVMFKKVCSIFKQISITFKQMYIILKHIVVMFKQTALGFVKNTSPIFGIWLFFLYI